MSKLLTLSIMTLILSAAEIGFAKNLVCRNLGSVSFFQDVKIEMTMPNIEDDISGDWKNQTVQLSWMSEQGKGKYAPEKQNIKLKTASLGGTTALTGDFLIGDDFGSVGISLFVDFDSEEIIALLDIFSDGPNTKELYRCK